MFKSIQLDPRFAFTPVDRGEFLAVAQDGRRASIDIEDWDSKEISWNNVWAVFKTILFCKNN